MDSTMKIHYAPDSTQPLACKKPIRWNTEITDEIDALTCETCIKRVKNLILAEFPKAKDGEGIFITSKDKAPLTMEVLKKNRELLALQQELDFANNCIRKAMAVPDYDSAVKMVQNELIPYVCKYQRTVK